MIWRIALILRACYFTARRGFARSDPDVRWLRCPRRRCAEVMQHWENLIQAVGNSSFVKCSWPCCSSTAVGSYADMQRVVVAARDEGRSKSLNSARVKVIFRQGFV